MQKKPLPRAIMICSFILMMLINIFSVKISSITLMLASALVSLSIFIAGQYKGKEGNKNGGENK